MTDPRSLRGDENTDAPWWLSGKETARNVGDPGSIPGSGRLLEKEMATHSSILAWRIPRAEEPSRLHSVGTQRVRRGCVTNFHIICIYENTCFECEP